MSGRHKPLMHVIFLFSPSISLAFPHRSLLFPHHFKKGTYFCLKPHALSLLIQGVRLHWDSKHTSSLNKLDIPFSPARGCLLSNQVWLAVGTPRVSFREIWMALKRNYWLTTAKSKYLDAHAVHSTGSLTLFFGSHPWMRCSHAKLALSLPTALCRLPSAQHWRFPAAEDTCWATTNLFSSSPHHFCQVHFA